MKDIVSKTKEHFETNYLIFHCTVHPNYACYQIKCILLSTLVTLVTLIQSNFDKKGCIWHLTGNFSIKHVDKQRSSRNNILKQKQNRFNLSRY